MIGDLAFERRAFGHEAESINGGHVHAEEEEAGADVPEHVSGNKSEPAREP